MADFTEEAASCAASWGLPPSQAASPFCEGHRARLVRHSAMSGYNDPHSTSQGVCMPEKKLWKGLLGGSGTLSFTADAASCAASLGLLSPAWS